MPDPTNLQIAADDRKFIRNLEHFSPSVGNLATPWEWGEITNIDWVHGGEEFSLKGRSNTTIRDGIEDPFLRTTFDLSVDLDALTLPEAMEQALLTASAANMTTFRPPALLQRIRTPGHEDLVSYLTGEISFKAQTGSYFTLSCTCIHRFAMGSVLTAEIP